MFHPIMPFFTEHLWHQASNILKNDTAKINKSEWPEGISVDEKDNIKIKVLLELISSIRSTRSEMNVPANAVIDINYSKISSELGVILYQHKEIIQSLRRSKSINKKNFSLNIPIFLKSSELILDIGCNDGILLNQYNRKFNNLRIYEFKLLEWTNGKEQSIRLYIPKWKCCTPNRNTKSRYWN